MPPGSFRPNPKPPPKAKKLPQPIPRYSKKKPRGVAPGEEKSGKQWEWFLERRPEMTGKCQHCGGETSKFSDEFFYFCVCHILPKSIFPSVATHPLNWIELCFWNNSCHTNSENKSKKFELDKLKCWPEIVRKFKLIYPDVAPSERGKIPEVLLQELEPEEVGL